MLYPLTWFDCLINQMFPSIFCTSFYVLWFSCQAELRASVFEAIEEEDRAIEKEEGLPPALLGSCNDRAKQLHASPSGPLPLLSSLSCINLNQKLKRNLKLVDVYLVSRKYHLDNK